MLHVGVAFDPLLLGPDAVGGAVAALCALFSKSQVSRLREDIDERVKAFLERPIDRDRPYVWFDATTVKVRHDHRVVSVALCVDQDGRREALGMDIGPSEAGTFWTEFLRNLRRRGLSGVKLIVSGAREGIKAPAAKPMNSTWQRCRIHTARNALGDAGRAQGVSAFIGAALAQCSQEAAKGQWRNVADPLRPIIRKLAAFMDEAETDALAYRGLRKEHWVKLHSTIGLDASTARSNAAPTSSECSPMKPPSPGSWAQSRSSKTTNGRSIVPPNMTLESMAKLSGNPIVGSPRTAI